MWQCWLDVESETYFSTNTDVCFCFCLVCHNIVCHNTFKWCNYRKAQTLQSQLTVYLCVRERE